MYTYVIIQIFQKMYVTFITIASHNLKDINYACGFCNKLFKSNNLILDTISYTNTKYNERVHSAHKLQGARRNLPLYLFNVPSCSHWDNCIQFLNCTVSRLALGPTDPPILGVKVTREWNWPLTSLQLVLRSRMVKLYLHCPVCYHGIVLKWLSAGPTLYFYLLPYPSILATLIMEVLWCIH
jgi:hypothetical protein